MISTVIPSLAVLFEEVETKIHDLYLVDYVIGTALYMVYDFHAGAETMESRHLSAQVSFPSRLGFVFCFTKANWYLERWLYWRSHPLELYLPVSISSAYHPCFRPCLPRRWPLQDPSHRQKQANMIKPVFFLTIDIFLLTSSTHLLNKTQDPY